MNQVRTTERTQIDIGPYTAQEAFVPEAVGAPAANGMMSIRLTHAAVAAGLLVVLLLSWWLRPDPRGVGTHEQLMLFPCNFHTVTGLPCPFCGMTTAFAHMAHGNVREAFLAQPMGAIGFIATIMLLPIGIGGLITGKDMVGTIMRLPWGRHSKVIVTMFAAAWIFKIVLMWLN